jgi:hypothetical protein
VELLLHLSAATVLHTTARVLTIISAKDMVSIIRKAQSQGELEARVTAQETKLAIEARWTADLPEFRKYHQLLVCRRLAQCVLTSLRETGVTVCLVLHCFPFNL